MSEPTNVTHFRLTQAAAEQKIHDLARVTANVRLTAHAKERMHERDISATDLYRILRQGTVDVDPELSEKGDWKCKITHLLRGRRTAGVVLAIRKSSDTSAIITVEWEDKR